MPDRKKVIKGLECCLANGHNNCPYKSTDEGIDKVTTCTTYLMQDALDLLKEQEAKPVKVTKNAYNYEFYHCPNCGRGFELTYYKRPAYCDQCGQAVKWE